VLLYKLNKFNFIIHFASVIVLFLLPFFFVNKLLELSFENNMEYILAYFIFLGLIFTLLACYAHLKTLPMYRYTIMLEDTSLIYKKADTIIYKFNLSDIEYIAQKQFSQVFILNLKNKKKVFLPFGLNKIPLFLNTLADNYHPKIKYNNHTFKAKKQGFISIMLILMFFPFILIPLLLSPYVVIFYVIGFIFTFFTKPKYLKILDDKLEIKNRSKTVFLSKEEIKKIELEHTFILRVGHFYQCKLSSIDHTYTLDNYNISNIDLYCLLNYWQKTYNKYEETNSLP
jgi:hypothetical protein